MRDSAIAQRVQHFRDRIEMLNRQLAEPFLTLKERQYLIDERTRANRRIAMVTEDERRPTFAPKQSEADEFRDWLKSVG